MMSRIRTRLRALVQRRANDDDLGEEIRYHVAREVERNIAKGMSADDARDAPRRAFGNVTIATERSREAWLADDKPLSLELPNASRTWT
jgi:hypothetical protein